MPGARWGTLAVTVTLVFAGCGGDDEQGLTARQARDLVQRLDQARTLAAAGNVAGVEEALEGFRGRVARLRQAGALDEPTARALRVGAARVLRRARADAPPPPDPAPVEPAPLPVPEKGKGQRDRKGDEEKKGHGKDKDDEKGDD